MKTLSKITTLLLIAATILVACNNSDSDKKYSLLLKGNSLYVTMPHPTMGVVRLDAVDWRGVSLSEVCEDIFQTLNESSISGECFLYVRFDNEHTDKYGNPIHDFDEHFITKIPISELRKYKGSKYLDDSYSISKNIYDAAFNPQEEETTSKDATDIVLQELTPVEATRMADAAANNKDLNPGDSARIDYGY